MKEKGLKAKSRVYPAETITDADYTGDLELLCKLNVFCIAWNRQ